MTRREWLRAIRRELDETRGAARVRWLLGLAWVGALSLLPELVSAGILAGVVGGAVGNREVFLEVYRSGSHSWIGALVLTVPTAAVGVGAALLLLVRHRHALAAAYAFAALVAVTSVLSVANAPPVGAFMDDWKRTTLDPRAVDHASELRVNSAVGAIVAAATHVALARRRRPRTR
jgi:hypothetical protein